VAAAFSPSPGLRLGGAHALQAKYQRSCGLYNGSCSLMFRRYLETNPGSRSDIMEFDCANHLLRTGKGEGISRILLLGGAHVLQYQPATSTWLLRRVLWPSRTSCGPAKAKT